MPTYPPRGITAGIAHSGTFRMVNLHVSIDKKILGMTAEPTIHVLVKRLDPVPLYKLPRVDYYDSLAATFQLRDFVDFGASAASGRNSRA